MKLQPDYKASRGMRLIYDLVYRMTCVWFKIFGKKTIDMILGLENLPGQGPYIIAANHLSYMDDFIVAYALRKYLGEKLYVPTNVKAFSNPLRHLWHTAVGGVPIDPANKEQTYATLRTLMDDGKIILMFPEGTRSDGNALLPFKYGTFNLASQAGVRIIPTALYDTHVVLPKHAHFFVKGKKASVYFAPEISEREIANKDPGAIKETCNALLEQYVYRDRNQILSQEYRDRSDRALGDMANKQLESLLDAKEASAISGKDVSPILEMLTLRRHTSCESSFTQVQYTRAYGFFVMSAPALIAVFYLSRLKQLLRSNLERDPRQPYANYMQGLLLAKLPRFLGGNKALATYYFARAMEFAEQYNTEPNRFAHAYATTLYKNGRRADAVQLIRKTIDSLEAQLSNRLERRRDRLINLLAEYEGSR